MLLKIYLAASDGMFLKLNGLSQLMTGDLYSFDKPQGDRWYGHLIRGKIRKCNKNYTQVELNASNWKSFIQTVFKCGVA